ncbi:MAG TPA: Na+/H+ antiporter subunit E [Planctomycetaceae bacterium]|nr:Na+/H+ antiporter subunit E [Planctomycetaceae bacterium]
MKALLINLFLALTLAGLMGQVTVGGLLVSYAAGYVLLWWLRPLLGPTVYFRKVMQTLSFLRYFANDLIHSNLRVAGEVLSIRRQGRAGIVAVPLTVKSDFEIMLLVSLITLTPGTLGVDISGDRRILYVHSMFVTSADEVRTAIKDGFERRVLELFR